MTVATHRHESSIWLAKCDPICGLHISKKWPLSVTANFFFQRVCHTMWYVLFVSLICSNKYILIFRGNVWRTICGVLGLKVIVGSVLLFGGKSLSAIFVYLSPYIFSTCFSDLTNFISITWVYGWINIVQRLQLTNLNYHKELAAHFNARNWKAICSKGIMFATSNSPKSGYGEIRISKIVTTKNW